MYHQRFTTNSQCKEIQNLLPNESYIFFADQKNVPYGGKTKKELVSLSSRIAEFLLAQKVKMVVVACNTSTCYSIKELRKKYSVPIVGVVPAIKTAAEQTKTGKIALISTSATARSPYVAELIQKFAKGAKVIRIGCDGLEDCVENANFESLETYKLLKKYVLPLKKSKIDKLVLGCTHYPFLRQRIAKILGSSVNLLDSGKAVARRVKFILNQNDLLASQNLSSNKFFTNKDSIEFSRVASKLLGRSIASEYTNI